MPAKTARKTRLTGLGPLQSGRQSASASAGKKARSIRATSSGGSPSQGASRPASQRPTSAASRAPLAVAIPVQLRTAVSRKPAITAAEIAEEHLVGMPGGAGEMARLGPEPAQDRQPDGDGEDRRQPSGEKEGSEPEREDGEGVETGDGGHADRARWRLKRGVRAR